jgi:hypothetical protein
MAAGASKGFGVLTKSNKKFMDCLAQFILEKEFVTLHEIYNEYMSKPKRTDRKEKGEYMDDGRWGTLRLTKSQLSYFLKIFPFITNEKYILYDIWKNKETEKKCLWSLTANWSDDLESFKTKLNDNYDIKTMNKYHRGKRICIEVN